MRLQGGIRTPSRNVLDTFQSAFSQGIWLHISVPANFSETYVKSNELIYLMEAIFRSGQHLGSGVASAHCFCADPHQEIRKV